MRRLRVFACGLCAAAAIALSGCSAITPAAVRVNYDGTIDYVTCASGTAGSDDWYAASYATTKQTDGVDIQPVDELVTAVAGQVVHFQRPASRWKSIFIGASIYASASARSDQVSLGEWRWNTDKHCKVNE